MTDTKKTADAQEVAGERELRLVSWNVNGLRAVMKK